MLDQYFYAPHVINRLRSSVLGSSLDDLAAHLSEGSYATNTVRNYLRAVGHLGYWLDEERISLSTVTEKTIDVFIHNHLPDCRCPVPFGAPLTDLRAAMGHVLAVLHKSTLIPAKQVSVPTPADVIITEFVMYLSGTRGATSQTCGIYTCHIRKFLDERYGTSAIEVSTLCADDLMCFVAKQAERYKPATAKSIVSALRSFIRFLQMKGLCAAHLVEAVPTVPEWKLSRLPKSLTDAQLDSLLAAFDRTTGVGRRDYAIALCLSQLGLRAGEVAELSLDNIDWRSGVLRIAKGKSRRTSLLPLPAQVGRAIVTYLRHGRPQTRNRHVFVSHIGPVGNAIKADAVKAAIRRGFKRAKIRTPSKGTHILRHTAATRMIRGGASLKEVADVLRHRLLDTTLIYAKVDIRQLAEVALPWPEVQL
jgi:site-specific recombinase XerD